jgi:hypothetical protein
MDKQINERLIKISSRLPLLENIELGEDIIVSVKVDPSEASNKFILNCVKTEDMDNQDGTINRIYTLKYSGE